MKFRTGLVVGGAVGYYLGAKAGRRRYEQLNRWIARLADTAPIQSAATRVKASVGLARANRTQGDSDPTLDLVRPEWSA